jgi:N-acetylglucosamine-6-sulfatase
VAGTVWFPRLWCKGSKGKGSPVRTGAIVAVIVCVLAQAVALGVARPATAATPPNIVVVMVDDMPPGMVDDLPRLRALLSERGLSFSSYYTQPVCCPARASFLRAQYPHNTGVLKNGPPRGGYSAFRNGGNESSTIATWLRDAGYRTALIGKYLNDYEKTPQRVPPGWNRWFVYAGKGKYRNFLISDQGNVRAYGKQNGKKKTKEKDYQTDLLARKAVQFINDTPDAAPLFLFLAPSAPHEPATPAKRHKRAAVVRDQAPRPPSFNEADMSDKSGVWRNRDALSGQRISEIDGFYVKQVRSMYAVEDMVADVLAALETTNRLDNTYVFFTSDNGYHHGEHRIPEDKQTPFDEVIRAPLFVLGPGVPAGAGTAARASVVDLGPTFAELAGIAGPDFVDGRSLVPFLDGGSASGWREAVIAELEGGAGGGFVALRSGPYAYVEYASGAMELYDLDRDPYQIDNIIDSAPPGLIDDLQDQLAALAACGASGPSCQEADGGP